MKTYGDLLNRLQDFYGTADKPKNYHPVQSEDIKEYLTKRNFPLAALKNLYDLITESESFLPKINKFKDIIDQALSAGSISTNNSLHFESPLQQLYRAKDWPVKKIIKNIQNIRKKQDWLWSQGQDTEQMLSRELSFLAIWSPLEDVQEEFLEDAKQAIVDNGDRQLRYPVDLGKWQRNYKLVEIKQGEINNDRRYNNIFKD